MKMWNIDDSGSGRTRSERLLAGVVVLLFLSYLLINLTGIYLTGAYAWDDGAITLAYSRTLAEEGIFALTKRSDIVEGTSSPLLVVLMALLHRVFAFDFDGFIRTSQLTAFAWVCLLLLLLYRNLRNVVPEPRERALIVLLLGTLPGFTAEVFNGMEMSLFALLLAAMTVSYQARSRWTFLLIPLLLLCRFESVFYLLFALSLLLLIEPEERRQASVLLGYVIAVFALLTLLRWAYFDDVLPNTIWAKMNPPYSKGSNFLSILLWKWRGPEEFFSVQWFLLLVSFALLFLRDTWRSRLDLKVLLVLSFAMFSLIVGGNAGYPGRMFLACWPLLVLITRDTFVESSALDRSIQWNYAQASLGITKEKLAFLVMVSALLATHWSNVDVFKINLLTAATGGYYGDRLPDRLNAALTETVTGEEQEFASWYGISPANFRITGTAVDAIRSLLEVESIKFMVPDVGGVGLCCENLDVIDSGLLSNRFLARNGWGKFDAQLRDEVPDVIETHDDPWSRLSKIYESSFFRQNYTPIVVDNNLLWIHRRHVEKLLASPRVVKSAPGGVEVLQKVRYGGLPLDMNYISSGRFEVIWVLRTK